MMTDNGRDRELPSWRKDFKSEWRKCQATPITLPLNEQYRPDPYKWVCTCPYFFKSRFLLCKHLVQGVHPVHPIFFLQVTRNRTTPFWSHPTLRPLGAPPATSTSPALADFTSGTAGHYELSQAHDPGEDSDEELVEIRAGATFDERLTSTLSKIRDFCDGLDYQRQFRDSRLLDTLEREGGSFFRFLDNCLSRERRENSTRSAPPTTWERSTANAMFYRTRPVRADRDT
ncbi:hypothetical protein K438DRAFT_1571798 [Mycena galopus ATCC 62051]|nr:hypothetical protein K438DRAFT_1571798 [Mycena galopus ATCC 62051]